MMSQPAAPTYAERVEILRMVRRELVGEDVSVDELLAMCDWVITGEISAALELSNQLTENYHRYHAETPDQFSYRTGQPSGRGNGKSIAPSADTFSGWCAPAETGYDSGSMNAAAAISDRYHAATLGEEHGDG